MSKDRGDVLGENSEVAPATEGRSLLGQIRLWGGIGAGALLVAFLAQNLQTAEVNFLWMSYDIRMIYALGMAAALGAITFFFLGVLRRRSRRKERRADRRN